MNICVFGDSIAWGEGDTHNGGWCDLLKRHFQENDPNSEVFNLGIPGDTVEGVRERLIDESNRREATHVILAVGVNDSQIISGKVRISEKVFEKNFEKLVKEAGCKYQNVFVSGLLQVDESKTTPIPWSPAKSYVNVRIGIFDRIIKRVAKVNDLLYVSMADVSTKYLIDGLHPDTRGHKLIYEKMVPLL